MSADSFERGVEGLVWTALAGQPCDAAGAAGR